MISKKRLMRHIENEYRQWGDDYDALQILGDIEDAWTWIPCSVKLPPEEVKVLVTCEGDCEIGWVSDGLWQLENFFAFDGHDVAAWMPLPEVYTESEV